MITITIHLNGNPLRRTYVSHFDLLRVPHTLFFRTNDLGQVTISNAGVTFGDPNGPAGATDITVHAQNVVARVLDANLGVEVSQRFTVSNGSIVNITTTAQQRNHFRIPGPVPGCLRDGLSSICALQPGRERPISLRHQTHNLGDANHGAADRGAVP